MSQSEPAATRSVRGIPLACPVCRHDRFHSRAYLLNTRAATFFNFDWANKAATAYVCGRCGHILWFAAAEEDKA